MTDRNTTTQEDETEQSDLQAEQLQATLRKLDVEFDSIITQVQMSQVMYPANGWIIDKLRKMKRGLQESIEEGG